MPVGLQTIQAETRKAKMGFPILNYRQNFLKNKVVKKIIKNK